MQGSLRLLASKIGIALQVRRKMVRFISAGIRAFRKPFLTAIFLGRFLLCRVEYMRNSNTATKYTSYSPVTAITLQNDYAIALDHFETGKFHTGP